MCIRDRHDIAHQILLSFGICNHKNKVVILCGIDKAKDFLCLLYTSDAADERSSVDLGGRRIIKKKKRQHYYELRIV